MTYRTGDNGVLYSFGDDMAGYALYVEDGKLKLHYNYISQAEFRVESEVELPEGELVVGVDAVKIRNDFGICYLYLNGQRVGRVEINCKPMFKAHGQLMAIGHFAYAPVCAEYRKNGIWRYSGKIDKVEFDLKAKFSPEDFDEREADALKTE